MEKAKKDERLKEIKELVVSFCVEHLNEELQSYALKLCDTLNRKRKISIASEEKIWADGRHKKKDYAPQPEALLCQPSSRGRR